MDVILLPPRLIDNMENEDHLLPGKHEDKIKEILKRLKRSVTCEMVNLSREKGGVRLIFIKPETSWYF